MVKFLLKWTAPSTEIKAKCKYFLDKISCIGLSLGTCKEWIRSVRFNGMITRCQDRQITSNGIGFVDVSVTDEIEVSVSVSRLELDPTRFHFVTDVQENKTTLFRCFSVLERYDKNASMVYFGVMGSNLTLLCLLL